jgi:predicted nucleic acid binding AN1-type Zn finger protein
MSKLQNCIVWEACDCCDEYLCNIHMLHASECDCPAIDAWAETEWNPYISKVTTKLLDWVGANSFEHED